MNLKRWICLLLALSVLALAGCDRRNDAGEEAAPDASASPEATAIGGLTQALEREQGAVIEAADEDVEPEEEPTAEIPADEPLDADAGDATGEAPAEEGSLAADAFEEMASPEPTENMPFATPTPQPNASVDRYSEIKANGLGFRFSYPTGWNNIPGRNTVCYVQPLENGTVYPARVAVTMKRMPHTVGPKEMRSEFADYVKTLMGQYDSDTFRVGTKLNEDTKFMGNEALSTTYLAYDGAQEIKGYAIITRFERYLYVFHFLCAYDDYTSFEATIRYMRDSVTADASVAPK